MSYIDIDGIQIGYERHGDPASAPSVMWVHGAGGSRLDWPEMLRQLPAAHSIALDLPGHGDSQPVGEAAKASYTIDSYADVVTALAERLDLRRVVIAGHSMGGAVAQTLGVRQPTWLAGLILVGTGARLRVAPATLTGVQEAFADTVDLVTSISFGPTAAPDVIDAFRGRLLQIDPLVWLRDFQSCDQFDVRRELGRIAVPVLVVGGSADKMTPLKFSRYLADEIADAELVEIAQGGHMMALEQPAAVAAAVTRYLSRLAP